jgi:hypothetical protein
VPVKGTRPGYYRPRGRLVVAAAGARWFADIGEELAARDVAVAPMFDRVVS